MKKLKIEIPDGHRAEWVNGVLTLVDEEPIEYKFKVGDKVKITIPNNPQYGEIVGLSEYAGEPLYTLKNGDANFGIYERYLELAPQSITERIKTFEDACKWCVENGKREMLHTYSLIFNGLLNSESEITEDVDDIIAYLKLRIITAALNEGWEPTFTEDEERWAVAYSFGDKRLDFYPFTCLMPISTNLLFKSKKIAAYAATQFADIYADFCDCKKGGKE